MVLVLIFSFFRGEKLSEKNVLENLTHVVKFNMYNNIHKSNIYKIRQSDKRLITTIGCREFRIKKKQKNIESYKHFSHQPMITSSKLNLIELFYFGRY